MFAFLKRLFEKKSAPTEEARLAGGACAAVQATEDTRATVLRLMGAGKKVNYEPGGLYSCACLRWCSEETDEDGQPLYIRESAEQTVKVPAELPFTAAGKTYRSISQLSPQDLKEDMDTDVHGRQVLCCRERFPCFDSFDYLHEHRYYRWYFIKEKGRLTRVYTVDESGWIHITEDVENVENKCVELLRKHGWVE